MAQVVSTFHAYLDVTHYNQAEDTTAYGTSRLEQFSFGEVSFEPVPQAPWLPQSRMHLFATIRHAPLWLNSVAGAQQNWERSMQPWLNRQLPFLQTVIENTNRFRAAHGRVPLDFRTLEVEIPPYTLVFPCQTTLDYGEKPAQIARFRELLNGNGALAEARPRIKRVQIPWQSPEDIKAQYDAWQAERAAEEAKAAEEQNGEAADASTASAEAAQDNVTDEKNTAASLPDSTMSETRTPDNSGASAEVEAIPITPSGKNNPQETEQQIDASEAARTNSAGDTCASEKADTESVDDTEETALQTDETMPAPLDYTLWKVSFVDGSSRILDSASDSWIAHDCAADPVQTIDTVATALALERVEAEVQAAQPPLMYNDVLLHERTAVATASALTEAQARYDRCADKRAQLDELLRAAGETGGVAIAVSGGVNSCMLGLEATRVLGDRALLLFAGNSPYQSARRLERLRAYEEHFGIAVERMEHPCAFDKEVRKNTYLTCYNCRYDIYSELKRRAAERGIMTISRGWPAGAEHDIEKGVRAARELGIRALLDEAGLDRADVLAWARVEGLPFVDEPDTSCLLSRYTIGAEIIDSQLDTLDSMEGLLHDELHLEHIRLQPEKDGLVSITVDDTEMHQMMGIEPERPISYRDLTVLGNRWKLTPALQQHLDDLFAQKEAAGGTTEDKDTQGTTLRGQGIPARSAVSGVPERSSVTGKDTHKVEEADASPLSEDNESPQAADLLLNPERTGQLEPEITEPASVATPYYLGDVLHTIFDELRHAGFKTVLIEDHLERRARAMDDDPWWIDRGPRLNAGGRG